MFSTILAVCVLLAGIAIILIIAKFVLDLILELLGSLLGIAMLGFLILASCSILAFCGLMTRITLI